MKLICITGKTGTGKSTIASTLAKKLNGQYVNIDKIGHQATSDPTLSKKICKVFGNTILDENGMINRKKLGNIVFGDIDKMQILTDLTWAYMEQVLDNILLQKQQYFIFDWALLPKVKYWDMCNMKIFVTSDDIVRKKRILERDHISPEYLEKREASALNYTHLTFDYIFDNDYTVETMHSFVETIYKKIIEKDK